MIEIWRTIPDFPDYAVSSQGRVKRIKAARTSPAGKVLAPSFASGYARLVLRREGQDHSRAVHQLVLEAFVGPCPPGKQCRHLNGDETVNTLLNLAWGTPKENGEDNVLHGKSRKGAMHPMAKLSELDVTEIRAEYKPFSRKHGINAIAKRLKMSPVHIGEVIRGQKWEYLS